MKIKVVKNENNISIFTFDEMIVRRGIYKIYNTDTGKPDNQRFIILDGCFPLKIYVNAGNPTSNPQCISTTSWTNYKFIEVKEKITLEFENV